MLRITHHSEFKGEDRATGRPLFTTAKGTCDCGRTVHLTSDCNHCPCGQDYTKSGAEWA